MTTKTFKKEELEDIIWGGDVLYNNIVDKGRWTLYHEVVFKQNNHFYKVYYSQGATEYQDMEEPFDVNMDGLVEVQEVFPKEKVIIVYE